MATITRNDESFVERDEVLFPNTNMVDTEPHYNNFTTIQNALRQYDEQRQINTTTDSRRYSTDGQYRVIRAEVEPSSHPYHSNEALYTNTQISPSTFTVPINIQSKKIDGHIFNLTQIIEDIGYNKNTQFIRSPSDTNIKNVSALLNIILKMGGAHGPLVNVWRSRINNDYFQRWYLEKYNQRSASLTQHNIMNSTDAQTTQNTRSRDYQSNITLDNIVSTKLPNQQMTNEKSYDREIKQIFGYDDIDTTSSVSSYSSSSEFEVKNNQQKSPSITSILKKYNNNNNNQNSPTKHRVTIRENYPTNEVNQSISSQQINNNNQNSQTKHHVTIRENYPNNEVNQPISSQQINNNQHTLSEYQQYIRTHPDFNYDQDSPTKHHVTIRENYPNNEVNQPISSQQIHNNQHTLSEYQQYIRTHPDFNYDQDSPTRHHVTIQENYPNNEVNQSISSQQINNNQHTLSDYQQYIRTRPYFNYDQDSQTKHHVTVQENYPTNGVNQSISSQQINNNQRVLSDYQQFIHNHPDLNNDPNPEIIRKSNPDHITYQQNVSVRYLVPPTPPPPGPLIIREIFRPRAPSPPPLIVKYQEPSPPTPPPLILREAPPPPPPHQETTILTKVLQPESQSSRRVIVEQSAPLPQKPQPIIIEKWLPYKPVPPREVIYEHVTENLSKAEFEPGAMNIDRPRRHSAEFQSNTERVSIPVNIQRRNSLERIENERITEQPTGTFEQLAWTTHQQILAMQQRGKEQVQAHRQWAANQWQQHANMFLQYPTQLTTPTLVVYHQPVTTSYVQTQEYRQQQLQYNPTFVYPFF